MEEKETFFGGIATGKEPMFLEATLMKLCNLKKEKEKTWGTGHMTQLVSVLTVQEWRTDFKAPAAMERAWHGCTHL